MLEIKDLEVYDLERSIVASGFAMATGELAEDFEHQVSCVKEFLSNFTANRDKMEGDLLTGKKHFERACKLGQAKSGSGHATFLSGIRVSFNLKYPEYISPELQRYHWVDIITSESKMHRLTKMDIKKSTNKYVDDVVIKHLNKLVNIYNEFPNDKKYVAIGNLTGRGIYFSKKSDNSFTYLTKYEIFMKIISNCPLGLEKWMNISTNYLQLATILSQRKGHKLREDWGAFRKGILDLPHFNELTGIED